MHPYLATAIIASVRAGQAILDIYNDPNSDFGIERKSDNSPLTVADKKANDIIVDLLKTETHLPIISEESKTLDYIERHKWEEVWIVDPLDGTKEFISKNGEFTVNIAFVCNGEPQMGVVYIPVNKTLYYGDTKTGEVFRVDNFTEDDVYEMPNLIRTRLPLMSKRSSCRVVASRSHMSEQTTNFIEELKKEHKEIELVSVGSSIKLCLVAEGNADIYPRFAPTSEWDTAAGHAILKAAGKNLYREDGITPLVYNKENLLNPSFIAK